MDIGPPLKSSNALSLCFPLMPPPTPVLRMLVPTWRYGDAPVLPTARRQIRVAAARTICPEPVQLSAGQNRSEGPLQLAEAENAVQIARLAGADRYAPDTFNKALVDLQNAEGFLNR